MTDTYTAALLALADRADAVTARAASGPIAGWPMMPQELVELVPVLTAAVRTLVAERDALRLTLDICTIERHRWAQEAVALHMAGEAAAGNAPDCAQQRALGEEAPDNVPNGVCMRCGRKVCFDDSGRVECDCKDIYTLLRHES